jgi:hypothetical protein
MDDAAAVREKSGDLTEVVNAGSTRSTGIARYVGCISAKRISEEAESAGIPCETLIWPGWSDSVTSDDLAKVVNPSYSVRPNGAVHQWRKDPPRKLSVGPGS